MLLRTCFVIVLVLTTLVAFREDDWCPQPDYKSAVVELAPPVLSVPMMEGSHFVMLEVEVNGKGPYAFWMDTGASIDACVDVQLAEELGLAQVGTVQNGDGSGRTQERPLVAIESIRLGDMKFEGLRAIAADYSWIDHGKVQGVGILGMDLFEDFLVTLNYPGARFELRNGALPKPANNHVANYSTESGIPRLEMRVGAERVSVHIDSGYRGVLSLPGDLFETVGIKGTRSEGQGRGVNGTFRTVHGTLGKPVHFAGWSWENLPGAFFEHYDHGLIGHGFMRHHAITLDTRNQRVHFGSP